MKKLILIIAIVFSGMLMQAQELNKNAKEIKEVIPEQYKELKDFVSIGWAGDHEMMVYGINQQADALVEYYDLVETGTYDKKILHTAMNNWRVKKDNYSGPVIWGGEPYLFDYVMIMYEYNNQIKAKAAY